MVVLYLIVLDYEERWNVWFYNDVSVFFFIILKILVEGVVQSLNNYLFSGIKNSIIRTVNWRFLDFPNIFLR